MYSMSRVVDTHLAEQNDCRGCTVREAFIIHECTILTKISY